MDALWEIERIMNNKNNKIVISINKEPGQLPTTIVGYATSDTFSLSSGAEYTEIADMLGAAAGGVIDKVLSILPAGVSAAAVSALAAVEGVNAVASMSGKGKTVAGSVRKWDGSMQAPPPIQLVFVALRPEDRPQDKAAELLAACLPGEPFLGTQDDTDLFFWAPNKYSPAKVLEAAVNRGLGYGGNIQGTCSLRIGQWFEAHGLLPESAAFEASKETTKLGNPLYVTGTVTFKTYRDMKAVEYRKQFLTT